MARRKSKISSTMNHEKKSLSLQPQKSTKCTKTRRGELCSAWNFALHRACSFLPVISTGRKMFLLISSLRLSAKKYLLISCSDWLSLLSIPALIKFFLCLLSLIVAKKRKKSSAAKKHKSHKK